MPDFVSENRAWVRENMKEPSKRRLLLAAIDAYDHCHRARNASASEIAPIVKAAKSRFTRVWEIAADFLMRLTPKHPAAREAALEMLKSDKVNERFQLVASLRRPAPKALLAEMVRAALRDKSFRVREKAAEAADRLQLRRLLPDLEAILAEEEHPTARRAIEFHAAMLRDGYLLRDEDGEPCLWVRTRWGWSTPPITKKAVEKGRLKSIVAKAREARP